jgi:hypothetical protein
MHWAFYDSDWFVIGFAVWVSFLAFVGYAAIVTMHGPHRRRRH